MISFLCGQTDMSYKGELQTKNETPSLSWWNLSYNHIIVYYNHAHVQGQM